MQDPVPAADGEDDGPDPGALADARARRRVLRLILVGVAASTFPVTVLSTAIPTIAADFDSELSVLAWVISAPLIALAVITPMAGKLGDLHGHRRLYLWGFVATGVLSFVTAASWSATALVVLRTVGQSAAAATGPASMALIVHTFPREERSRALGAWASVTAISPTVGVLVGGPLTDAIGWRSIFLIQGVLALAAVVVSRRALPETPRKAQVHFDLAGGLTLGLGVGSTLLAINRAAAWGFTHPAVAVTGAVGMAGFLAFLRAERRAREPIIPVDLLRSRSFTSPLLAQFVLNGSYMGTLLVTPVYLERLMGYGATARGLVTIPRPLGFAIGAALGGRAEPRLGVRTVVVVGTVGVTVSMLVQGFAARWQSLILVLVALFLAGVGNGYCRPAIASAVTNAADEGDAGVAAASLNTVSQVGAAAGNTIYTAMAGESTDPNRFLFVFLVAAATGVIAIAMAFRLQEEPPDPAPT